MAVDRGFVRMSAHRLLVRMYVTVRLLLITFSLTKKISSSICLVLECRTWLWDKATTIKLSRRILGTWCLTLTSKIKDWSHKISVVAWARLLYFSSALDLATSVCFLSHQEITLGHSNMQAPEVDLLSLDLMPNQHHKNSWW